MPKPSSMTCADDLIKQPRGRSLVLAFISFPWITSPPMHVGGQLFVGDRVCGQKREGREDRAPFLVHVVEGLRDIVTIFILILD